MPREVPLKLVKQAPSEEEARSQRNKKPRVSPYDIILGKIDLNYQEIPSYM